MYLIVFLFIKTSLFANNIVNQLSYVYIALQYMTLAWLCTTSPWSRYRQVNNAAVSSAWSASSDTDTELGGQEGQEGGGEWNIPISVPSMLGWPRLTSLSQTCAFNLYLPLCLIDNIYFGHAYLSYLIKHLLIKAFIHSL